MTDDTEGSRTFRDLTVGQRSRAPARRKYNAEGLTPMQAAFVLEYLIDLNASAAAIRAGASPATAGPIAAAWMKAGGKVANAVALAMAERSKRVGITQDRVLQELGRLAFGDPRSMFREDGSLRAPAEYDTDDAMMIEGIKTRRIVEIGIDPETGRQKMVPVEIQEVKLVSKTTALGMIMRHLGMNNDKLDINVTSLADRLNEAYRRTGRIRPADEGTLAEVPDAEYEMVDEAQFRAPDIIDGEAVEMSIDDMLKGA